MSNTPLEKHDLDALWQAFWDDPACIDKRLVLADLLQQLGDPRGELIALQHGIEEGSSDRAAARRVNELLNEKGDAWCGPLPNLKRDTLVFRTGFLSEVHCTATDESLLASVGERHWRTIERLTLESLVSTETLLRLIDRMPLLRALHVSYRAKDLAALGPFPNLVEVGSKYWFPEGPSAAFPNLRVLATEHHSFSYQRFEKILVGVRACGVERLILNVNRVEALLRRLARAEPAPALRVCATIGQIPYEGWTVVTSAGVVEDPVHIFRLGRRRWDQEQASALVEAVAAAGFTVARMYLPKARAAERARGLRAAVEGQQLTIDVTHDPPPTVYEA